MASATVTEFTRQAGGRNRFTFAAARQRIQGKVRRPRNRRVPGMARRRPRRRGAGTVTMSVTSLAVERSHPAVVVLRWQNARR